MLILAQLIEDQLKAEIAEAGRTITDPAALVAWMSDHGIGRSAMSAATGADFNAVQNKERAGVRGPQATGTDAYERLSQSLTPENFPGDPTRWEEWKPKDILIERLGKALQDTVAVLYADILGRWPDAEGRTHYEGQLASGRPRWEIVREIELSDEALAK